MKTRFRCSSGFGVYILFVLAVAQPANAEEVTWKTMLMPGEVIEGHLEYENSCGKCHAVFEKKSQNQLCLDCHKEIRKDFAIEHGFHGRSIDRNLGCKTCHTEHIGRDAKIMNLDTSNFNHDLTDFSLEDGHLSVSCQSCHKADAKYREAPGECVDCHRENDRHNGNLGTACHDCHSAMAWDKAEFDHSSTKFNLTGKHEEVQCRACHPGENYEKTPEECFACHVLNDVHAGNMGNQCGSCHEETGWSETSFDHNTDTDFRLEGKHTELFCENCHQPPASEKKLQTQCHACHRGDDEHKGKYGNKCETCHQEESWSRLIFDHQRDTEFPLHGSHKELACENCHRGSIKEAKIGKQCFQCHVDDDVHLGQQGKSCNDCHAEVGWLEQVLFNHDLTKFPLTGIHAITSCDSCHTSREFQNAGNRCTDCHSQDDAHKQGLGANCGDCHSPNGWQWWVFDHDRQTKFTLEGAHSDLSCSECHHRPVSKKIKRSQNCISCHLADDIHSRKFGRDCGRCHTANSFKELRLN